MLEFATKFKKNDSALSRVQDNVKVLHSAILKGRMKKEFRAILENGKIPKEALFKCTGLVIDDFLIDVDNVLTGIKFRTESLNVLQLACVTCSIDIFQFLANEMNLRHLRDLGAHHQMIHEMPFVYVPILRRNGPMLRELV